MPSDELIARMNEINKKIGSKKFKTGDQFEMKYISTGSLGIDQAMGGGFPTGRFVLLWGGTGSGKSTLAMRCIANAQAMGKACMWIDTEGHYSTEWASNCGIDTKELIVHNIQDVETITETTAELIKHGLIDVVVFDSINNINYTKFYDDNNNSLGLHARAMNDLVTRLLRVNNDTLFIVISQVRTKMAKSFGYSSYSGGNGIGHNVSCVVRLSNTKDYLTEEKDDKWIDWEVTESNISTPLKTGRYILYADGSIDTMMEAVSIGIKNNLLNKSGNWISMKDSEEKFNGISAFRDYLMENPDAYKELKDEILKGHKRSK